MIANRKFPHILPQGKAAWIIAILFFTLLAYFFFFEYSHPPTTSPFYKEYSTVSELYKNATLGDRVKVTLFNPTVSNGGVIQYNSPGAENVVFKIPQTGDNPGKIQPGRNTIYCHITQRVGAYLICEVESITT